MVKSIGSQARLYTPKESQGAMTEHAQRLGEPQIANACMEWYSDELNTEHQ